MARYSHTFLREFNESLNLLSARGVESRRMLPSVRIWDFYCHQPRPCLSFRGNKIAAEHGTETPDPKRQN